MMILKDKEHVESVDWLTVAEIIAAAGLNQRDVALVERAFRHSTFCWFGYENGQLIAVARAISDLTWCSYLADVAVHPRCQGKGYGQQLMHSVSDRLRPFGKTFIYSVVDKVGFYRRFGFETLTTGMVCASEEAIARMREQGFVG